MLWPTELIFLFSFQALRGRGSAVTVNGEVLRAVVELLNQNEGGLTTKQQIKLLNSLGVIVATVKNPVEMQKPNMAATPYADAQRHEFPATATLSTKKPRKQAATGLLSGVTGFHPANYPPSVPATTLKRKNDAFTDGKPPPPKKARTSDPVERTSLQHLTALELDEKVSQALASVGAVPYTPKSGQDGVKKDPATKKTKKSDSHVTPAPSVPIPLNKSFLEALRPVETKCPRLREYVELRRKRDMSRLDLFPVGPFCVDSDQGVCTCLPAKCKIFPVNNKRKSGAKASAKIKQCQKCKHKQTRDDGHYDAILQKNTCWNSTLKLFDGKVGGDFWALQKPDLAAAAPSEARPGPKLAPTPADFHCHCLQRCRKRFKRLLSEERRALELLLSAAKSDQGETARVLADAGATPFSRKKHCDVYLRARRCKLAGGQCRKKALPYAEFCSEHIWHCEHQQLFKLDAGMAPVPDIHPEPVVAKPRKRTKLPPLSKKKKRRAKKTAAGKSRPNAESAKQKKSPNKAAANATKNDNCVKVKSEPDRTGDVCVTSGSMSQIADAVLAVTDDESVMDAFNLDGTEFMSDVMPDLMQEFNLFASKTGDVLDCALLSGNPLDADGPDRLTLDEESQLFFPLCSELEAGKEQEVTSNAGPAAKVAEADPTLVKSEPDESLSLPSTQECPLGPSLSSETTSGHFTPHAEVTWSQQSGSQSMSTSVDGE